MLSVAPGRKALRFFCDKGSVYLRASSEGIFALCNNPHRNRERMNKCESDIWVVDVDAVQVNILMRYKILGGTHEKTYS